MSAGTGRRKEEENSYVENNKKEYFPSYLSDRTDEVVVFWSALLLRKAEEGIKRQKCNGLDTPSLERRKDRQEFESEVALGAQPHGKQ